MRGRHLLVEFGERRTTERSTHVIDGELDPGLLRDRAGLIELHAMLLPVVESDRFHMPIALPGPVEAGRRVLPSGEEDQCRFVRRRVGHAGHRS